MNSLAFIVIAFTLLTMLLGFWTYYKVHNSALNYYKAGGMMSFWVVGITLCAQAFDANGSIGTANMSFASGFWTGASIPLGLSLCLLITGLFFAKPIQRMNLMTLADFYHRRYNRSTETLATLSMLASNIILIAGNLAGLGLLYSLVFGIDYLPMLLVVSFCILAYAITGGLFASIVTSLMQVAVFSVAVLVCFIWLTWQYNLNDLMAAVPDTHTGFLGLTSPEHGAYLNWAALISLGLGDVIAIDFMQRVISSRSPEDAQKGCFIGAAITLIVGLPVAFIGLYAFHIHGLNGENLLVDMAMNKLPAVLGTLLILGIIAASMSTAAGVILALSNMITRNLLQRYMRRQWDNNMMLRFSRLIALPTFLAAVAFAYAIPQPGILLILAFDVVLAGCFVPLLLGIYWRKANAAAAISSIVIGAISRITLHFTIPTEWAGFDTLIPPVISLLTFVSVTLATQQISKPKSKAFEYIPTEKELVKGQY